MGLDPQQPTLPSTKVKRFVVVLATATALVAVSLSNGMAAVAANPQTVFATQSFTGATAPGYIKPTAPAGANSACLTAGTDAAANVPGCANPATDSVGSGALRLTTAGNGLEGGVGATQSVPISKGLDVAFDSYQYGGNGADGIAFYLAVTDPYNPQVPTAIGQAGGSLGYSATGASSGLANGYLGLGLDAYGNFLNSGFDGTGCSSAPGNSTQPTNVTVRGPGNNAAGYCVLPGYNSSLGGRTALEGTTRANSDVPVEVAINSAAVAVASAGTSKLSSVSVPARSYAIVFKTIGAASQTVVSGTLPDLRSNAYTGLIPSSWFDSNTGLPFKLTYGWVASTGGSTDTHEINQFSAQSLAGPVPTLTATSAVTNSTPAPGATDTYTVSPAVAAAGGPESAPVQVTTTFPTGITPTAYPGTDYTCTIDGQTESCTYTGTIAAGSALPALVLPFTATGPASASPLSISSVVSSTDATAVQTSSSVTITKIPTTTTVAVSPATTQYGTSQTITANVGPVPDGGTVAIIDTTTGQTLCAAAPVTAGVATCVATATGPIGAQTITATYSGDATYAPSSGTTTSTVTQATSTIGVTASPADISYGGASTLTATGMPAGATGAVTFTDASGTVLCTTTAATPSCTTATTLPAGTYAITAHYAGDANHTAADSASTAPLQVDRATTTLAAAVNGAATSTIVYGGTATLSATGVIAGSTGQITFTDTSTGATLCTATLPATSCATDATLAAGTYTVEATYSGDANHAASTSTNQPTLVVTPVAAPAIVASVDHPSVPFGTTATFATSGIPTTDTGTITYTTADGTVLCTATLPAVSCASPASLAAGTYEVTATYSGDANHQGAATTPIAFEVTKVAGTLLATVNNGPNATTVHGTSATLNTSGLAAGATGTITYTASDGSVLCIATLPTTNCATASNLAGGNYTITATYSGDANHVPATGPTVNLIVAPQPTAVAGNGTASLRGSENLTTVNATGIPPAATGTITFTSNGAVLCTATLPATSCTTTALAAGTHTVLAAYSGDPSYAASQTTFAVHVSPSVFARILGFTGANPGPTAASGIFLLLLGLGALLITRRRRNRLEA
ncbi:Ig-like domain repeat protein [Frigoribacterium sp. UYMn621]|uniref:Ig-like domain repeat protein n=1 Tax=Frigoribacterium sp. UYMn621 TaxID=3156343 RepID=UPI0033916F4D